jgi:hypothetical protein
LGGEPISVSRGGSGLRGVERGVSLTSTGIGVPPNGVVAEGLLRFLRKPGAADRLVA